VAILSDRTGRSGSVAQAGRQGRSRGALLLWVFLLIGLAPLHAQPSREYQIKAAFIFNFAQFTEWPANAFAATNAPIVIGVLGTNPFAGFLENTVQNESVRGHPLVVHHYKTVEEIQTCHILYIGQSEGRRLQHIIAKLKGKPVLTVSDIPEVANEGVAIGFVTERNHVKLQINLEALKTASLTVSSKLLRLAQIVKD
jgi:hypothetical protein